MTQPTDRRLITEASLATALLRQQKLITIDDLPANGVHSAHRSSGGGNANAYIGPDGSLSSARLAIALGYHIMDCDIQLTQDGIPVVMHDQTLDRTTSGTGLVSLLPQNLLPPVDMRYMVGNGWAQEPVPTLEEWLATLGGRVVLTLEPKQVPTGILAIAPMIKGRGLERSVLVNCVNTDIGTMNSIASAGLYAHVYGGTTLADVTALSAYTNIEIFELPFNASTTIVNAALALPGGPRVLAAPIRRRTERDAMTVGFNGYVSDALGYLDKVTDRRDIIGEIARQKVGAGWFDPGAATGNNPSVAFPRFGSVTTGPLLSTPSPSSARRDFMFGSMCGPKPGTYDFDVSVYTGGWVGDTNARPRIRVACPSDEGTSADADTRGYSLGLRKSGQMVLWSGPVTYGAGVALGTVNLTGSTADSTVATWRVRAEITPTTIAQTRLDTPAATLSGAVTAGTITSLPVNAVVGQINSGGRLRLPNGQYANVAAQASAGATSVTVTSFTLANNLPSGAALYFSTGAIANTDWRGDYLWVGGTTDGSSNYLMECPAAFWGVPAANLSADVSAGTITSLTVFPLAASIPSGTLLRTAGGTVLTTSALANSAATTISVTSVAVSAMKAGDTVYLV